jgi:hypothetical protein
VLSGVDSDDIMGSDDMDEKTRSEVQLDEDSDSAASSSDSDGSVSGGYLAASKKKTSKKSERKIDTLDPFDDPNENVKRVCISCNTCPCSIGMLNSLPHFHIFQVKLFIKPDGSDMNSRECHYARIAKMLN